MNLHLQVVRKAQEAVDICVIDLASPDGKNLPPFTAGSHIDLHLPGGIIRQYSICNNPNDNHKYQIAVLKDPNSRGGSVAIHNEIIEGQILEVSAPKNHFPLDLDAKKSLLLAAGIGITPLLSMAEHLSQLNAEFEMHYCSRTPERTAFLEKITRSSFGNRVHFYFSQAANSTKLELNKLLSQVDADCHIYVCGPKKFLDAVFNQAKKIGWPENQLHYEFFTADIIRTDADESFDVKLASTGQIVNVKKDQTVTQALSDAGVDILISCEQGVCGTCLTGVIEGIPDHRDSYLTAEERAANNQFTPCCSRSKTAQLVIDL